MLLRNTPIFNYIDGFSVFRIVKFVSG